MLTVYVTGRQSEANRDDSKNKAVLKNLLKLIKQTKIFRALKKCATEENCATIKIYYSDPSAWPPMHSMKLVRFYNNV